MVKTGPTEISIYGHNMDVNRQISPYMGINGHTQTDGQNGSYDNRYNGVCIKERDIHSLFTLFNGVCIKGGTGTVSVSATQSEAQTDTEISIMGNKGTQTNRYRDIHIWA